MFKTSPFEHEGRCLAALPSVAEHCRRPCEAHDRAVRSAHKTGAREASQNSPQSWCCPDCERSEMMGSTVMSCNLTWLEAPGDLQSSTLQTAL
mmetsp:Transcript_42857/g.123919  ORF Transcript_42857/g.123919 Transcript_42857/m.123919 type:complete len:93 (-) Transcript_42857:60-338(-)